MSFEFSFIEQMLLILSLIYCREVNAHSTLTKRYGIIEMNYTTKANCTKRLLQLQKFPGVDYPCAKKH